MQAGGGHPGGRLPYDRPIVSDTLSHLPVAPMVRLASDRPERGRLVTGGEGSTRLIPRSPWLTALAFGVVALPFLVALVRLLPPVRSPPDAGRRPGPDRPAHPAGADLEAAARACSTRTTGTTPVRRTSTCCRSSTGCWAGAPGPCSSGRPCSTGCRAVACVARRAIPEHPGPGAVGRGVDLCPRGSAGRLGARVHDLLRDRSRRSGQPLEPDGRDVPAPPDGPAVRRGGRPFRAVAAGRVGGRLVRRPDRHLHRPGGGRGRRGGDSGLGGHVGGRPRPAGSRKTCRGEAARLVGSSALDRRTNPADRHRGHCRCDVAPSLRPTAVQQPGKLHAHRPLLLPSPRDVPLCGRLEISAVGGRRPSRRTGRGHALALGPGRPPPGPGMDGDV